MPKFDFKTLGFFLIFTLIAGVSAYAADDYESSDLMDLEDKARQAHKRAASDMMYQNEEWKALYYQNQQVIQILKQIRDSLDVIKARDNLKNTEEKTT